MATKIRLQRGGRKSYAFYSIVIADVRAPRDGKFTEKIGTFNPNTNPATVDLNFERALYWVETGAQPTDTVRNILKGEGVYLMKHLKGALRRAHSTMLRLRSVSTLGRMVRTLRFLLFARAMLRQRRKLLLRSSRLRRR